MVASSIFKLAGRIASRMADKSADSGLPRIEKLFKSFPEGTVEKIAATQARLTRGDEAWTKGSGKPSPKVYEGPMEEVDEVILDAPLTRSEREYFTNISKSGSGFSEKKLSPTEVEFFEEMLRKGDPYEFKTVVPSAKIRTDAKGNKYLRVQGKKGIDQLYEFLEPSIESGLPSFAKGEMPSQMRDYKWYDRFKDIKEFKHGGGLSSVNKPITINGQRHNLAWIRPDEASALKAMGGSGKKVGGIPAYFDEWSMGGPEAEQQMVDAVQPDGSIPDADTSAYDDPESPAYKQLISKEAQAAIPSATTYYKGETTGPARYLATEKIPNFMEEGIPDKLVPYWNALKDRGMSNQAAADYLSGMGTAGLTSMERAYDTEYSFGGPMGTMAGMTRDIASDYAKKLKLKEKMKKLKDIEDDDTLSEEQREEKREEFYSSLSKTFRDTGGVYNKRKRFGRQGWFGEDFDKTAASHNLHPAAAAILKYGAPGAAITRGLGGLADLIADMVGDEGTFTTEAGKEFSLRDTGKLIEQDMAAIPTEDSPEPVTEIARAVAPSPEVVAEAGPMETFQAGLQSIESNEGIENSIQILMNNSGVSESEARRMLGLDVNIA